MPKSRPATKKKRRLPDVIAAGFVVRRDGKILLQEEMMNSGERMWVFPGGHVNYSEKVSDAVKRELLEETGLNVAVGKFLGIHEAVYPEHGYHAIIFFNLARPLSGILKPERAGVPLKFFSLKDAKKLKLVGSAKWAISAYENWFFPAGRKKKNG